MEQVYKGGNSSKNTNQAEYDRVIHGRKHKEGESALPTNPKKGRSGKHKEKNAGHPSDQTTSAKKTQLLHVPGHSTEDCKLQ